MKKVLRGSDAQVAKAVPLFAALLSLPTGERYPPLEVSPQKRKEMLLEALADQVVELSKIQPVLIDLRGCPLDRSDQPGGARPVGAEASGTPRPAGRHVPAGVPAGVRARWSEQPHVRKLGVGRLTRREGEELVNRVTLGRSLPAEVLEKDRVACGRRATLYRGADQVGAGVGPAARGRRSIRVAIAALSDGHSELAERLAAGASGPPGPAKDAIAQVKDVIHIGACIGREFSHELVARSLGARARRGLGRSSTS